MATFTPAPSALEHEGSLGRGLVCGLLLAVPMWSGIALAVLRLL